MARAASITKAVQKDEMRRQTEAEARSIIFQESALKYIAIHKPTWKNTKHAAQWLSTLEARAFPAFGDEPIGDVNKDDIIKALKPIWQNKTETATRVRSCVERILDWATAHDYRQGDNPARGRGFIYTLLGDLAKLKKGGHHNALDYKRVAEFIAWLPKKGGATELVFELTILTATRTNEVLCARWEEIWTIPPERKRPTESISCS